MCVFQERFLEIPIPRYLRCFIFSFKYKNKWQCIMNEVSSTAENMIKEK